MYEILKMTHSWWAYLVLILILVAIINACIGFFSKRDYKQPDYRIGLFTLIVTHIQLLLGIVLYFISPLFNGWKTLGIVAIMKDAYLRKMLVEHPFGVIVGIILITMGWSLHKKQKTSQRAFGKIALFYALGLLLILGVIPWATWLSF